MSVLKRFDCTTESKTGNTNERGEVHNREEREGARKSREESGRKCREEGENEMLGVGRLQ